MLIYLNGENNMVILPKETLEALHNPKYFQVTLGENSLLIRYSNRKLAEPYVVQYPLKYDIYGFHLRNDNLSKSLRNHFNWDNYIYAVDAIPFLNTLVADPSTATKTEMSNKGL